MFVAQAGERRINRADHKLDTAPFESEHFRIAKRLRDYRVTGIKVTQAHGLKLWVADGGLRIEKDVHVAI
jgi:hypothetical protein